MQFGVREWMILIGGLLIIAVIADGIRRMIRERRDHIRMSINASHSRFDDDEWSLSELPGGRARVVSRDGSAPVESADPAAHTDDGLAMESFSAGERVADPTAAHHARPDTAAEPPAAEDPVSSSTPPEPEPELEPEPEPEREPARHEAEVNRSSTAAVFDEVLVVHVIARGDDGFSGSRLLELLLACDLRFGDLDIFHRHEQARGRGAVQFSVANVVKPGTFDLDEMNDFATPGVSLFMRLPGPAKPMEALDCLIETARSIARNLDGEMRDEGRSVLTPQTLEHYRQRIRDFERRRLAGTVG